MAMTPEQLVERMLKHFEKIEAASKRTDTHWQDIGRAIESSTRQFDKGFLKAATSFTGLYPTVKSIGTSLSSAFTGSTVHLERLSRMMTATAAARRREADPLVATRMLDNVKRMRDEYKASVKLTREVGDIISSKWAVAAVAFAGELKLAFNYSKLINQQLMQTSADYANRARLAREIAQVQAATGNEMADMAKAGAALANYGFDLRSGFKDTLSIMVKMEEGLGVSYETSAQMAVMARRIGGDFKGIADSVARIKADTALSAEEATKYAAQISKAVMMLRPGSGTLINQTSDYISRVAAALKELTGSGQGFVDMLSGFTTEAGMMGAATLGATPDFLSNPARIKEVTDRFVKYVDSQLAGTSGFQRMATIQLLAEQFNTSADVIANASEMMKKYNATQRHKTSLEEEWRKQTSELHKTISKLYASSAAVIQQTLVPAIRVLNPILERVTSGVQWFAKSGAALYAGIGLLAVSMAGAVVTTYKLIAALRRYSLAAGLTGNVTPAGGAAAGLRGTVMAWLPRIGAFLQRIVGPIGLIAGAAYGGWLAGKAIEKYLVRGVFGIDLAKSWTEAMLRVSGFKEVSGFTAANLRRGEIVDEVSKMVESRTSASAIAAFLEKTVPGMRGLYGGNGTKWVSREKQQEIVKDLVGDVLASIQRQKVILGNASLTVASPENIAAQKELISLWQQIYENSNLQIEIMRKVDANNTERLMGLDRKADELSEEGKIRHLQFQNSMSNINLFDFRYSAPAKPF